MPSSYALVTIRFEKLQGLKLKVVACNDQVDMFAGSYALQRYGNGRKPNSIKSDQNSILNLYRFCEASRIDLIGRIANLKPLSIGEIESFSIACGYRRDTGGRAAPGLFQSRMRIALSFINYLWAFYKGRSIMDEKKANRSSQGHAAMEAGFALYLKAPYNPGAQDRVGLTPELQDKFIEIIDPSANNKLNPWLSEKIRWRNYILLLLLMLGGNRKGETLLMKLSSLQLFGPKKYYEVTKKDDVDYPRAEQPSVKTFGRIVDIHDVFAAHIVFYIVNIRKLFKGHRESGYLFLSNRDGLPLSLQTPNAILNSVIKRYPEFDGLLAPHRLRNTFHDMLEMALERKFHSESAFSRMVLKQPIQEAAGGWALGSRMPSHYAKGAIKAKGAKVQVQLQKEILTSHQSDNGDAADEILL